MVKTITLPGRSLMFIRNVGHLMTNNAILDKNGEEVPEGIMDGVITSLIAKHDLLGNTKYQKFKKRFYLYCKTKNAWFKRSSICKQIIQSN